MSAGEHDRPLPELARRLIEGAEAVGVRLRALGGLGVHFRAGESHPALRRSYADIDLAARRSDRHEIERYLRELEMVPEAEFNALNGGRRQIWWQADGSTHLDVFLGRFSMCHAVSLEDRLPDDHPALPAADLLLTKLQVVELNRKDVQDAGALLATHELAATDAEGAIGLERLKQVLGADWGFYTTVTDNLSALPELVGASDAELAERVRSVSEPLLAELAEAPKSRGFRLRAKLGRRKRWYDLPEESIPT